MFRATRIMTVFLALSLLVGSGLVVLGSGCAPRAVYVKTAPPAPPEEVRPPRPSATAVWIPGHWKWNGNEYVWVSGRWELYPKGRTWVPGHWKKTRRGWKWVPGHWKK